jgi:hypothetical protein
MTKHVHHDMIIEWAKDASRKVQFAHYHPLDTMKILEIDWFDCPTTPEWNPNKVYRFKPEPKVKYYYLLTCQDNFGEITTLLQRCGEYNWLIDDDKIISRSATFKVVDGMFPEDFGNFLDKSQYPEEINDNSI